MDKTKDYIERNKIFINSTEKGSSHILEVAEHWNKIMNQQRIINLIKMEVEEILYNPKDMGKKKLAIDCKLEKIELIENNIREIINKF